MRIVLFALRLCAAVLRQRRGCSACPPRQFYFNFPSLKLSEILAQPIHIPVLAVLQSLPIHLLPRFLAGRSFECEREYAVKFTLSLDWRLASFT